MSIKDKLILLRKGITEKKESSETFGNYMMYNALDKICNVTTKKQEECRDTKIVPIVLDDKVNEFIDWFTENMVKGHCTDIGEYSIPIDMRNFIEKMAVWYELRYPDYEINRIMPGSSQEQIDINEVMFSNNKYTNYILDENSDIKDLDWNEFYNAKAFINSLPWSE